MPRHADASSRRNVPARELRQRTAPTRFTHELNTTRFVLMALPLSAAGHWSYRGVPRDVLPQADPAAISH